MNSHSLHTKAYRIAILSQLAVIMFATKMAMASLPNIEPVSILIIVYTTVLGAEALIPIYLYVVMEYLIWGINVWSICYLYVWLILWAIVYAFRRIQSPGFWAAVSGIFGLFFGSLCSIVYVFIGGWAYAFAWWVSGIPFDLLHSAGNFVLALLLYKPLMQVFSEFEEKRGP